MKKVILFFDEQYKMAKIWKYDNAFKRKIQKLESKNKYSFDNFKFDVTLFLKNELNPKFRKHKLN
jgi:mRNA-degrading endonuclease YafQ of YafQ-DinJ toxin-antitoxin module